MTMFRGTSAAKYGDAWVGVFGEVNSVMVNEVQATWQNAELHAFDGKVFTCLETPIHDISLGGVKRCMEDGDDVLWRPAQVSPLPVRHGCPRRCGHCQYQRCLACAFFGSGRPDSDTRRSSGGGGSRSSGGSTQLNDN